MYSTLLCQSLIQCFAVEQQLLKVSLFSFFFFKKNQTTNQPKPNQSFMSFSIMSVNDLNLEYHCLCSSCYYCFHCGCSYTDSCH